MIFTKNFVANSRTAQLQLNNRDSMRNAANAQEKMHEAALRAGGFAVNEGIIPRDVYQEFDSVTTIRVRTDDGDAFLNDLMPLAKAVNIGKLTYVDRKASDAGQTQTSMTGQVGIKMDQVEYNYDGTIIPVHDNGFFRNWRELAAGRAEGFDALIDDQRESVESVRRRLADSFMDGHLDANGSVIEVDGRSWSGMRNDGRVQQVDLGAGGVNFDFTDNSNSGDDIKAALITVLDFLYITNDCERDVTVYVSRQMARNWERNFSTEYNGGRIIDQLAALQGVASIKVSNKLTGNQLMAFPLEHNVVCPIVGMGMSTMALPRPMYNSNHEFVTATALGWKVKTDYFGKTCALYAAG